MRNWFNKIKKGNKYTPGSEGSYYWHFPAYKKNAFCHLDLQEGYTEISFDKFKNIIMSKKPGDDTKKILGYICPFDLFEGAVKEGELFLPIGSSGRFYKTASTDNTAYPRHLPKEIVEKWVPKYADVYSSGDYVVHTSTKTIYRIHKEGELFLDEFGSYRDVNNSAYRLATVDEVNEYEAQLNIDGYAPEVGVDDDDNDSINFGCVQLSEQKLRAYRYLFTSDARASLAIRGTQINQQMVDRLLDKLKNK